MASKKRNDPAASQARLEQSWRYLMLVDPLLADTHINGLAEGPDRAAQFMLNLYVDTLLLELAGLKVSTEPGYSDILDPQEWRRGEVSARKLLIGANRLLDQQKPDSTRGLLIGRAATAIKQAAQVGLAFEDERPADKADIEAMRAAIHAYGCEKLFTERRRKQDADIRRRTVKRKTLPKANAKRSTVAQDLRSKARAMMTKWLEHRGRTLKHYSSGIDHVQKNLKGGSKTIKRSRKTISSWVADLKP